ncbi:MAG: UvrD-helicase domain-containing protein [Candidatus Nanopelagicales bacterium]
MNQPVDLTQLSEQQQFAVSYPAKPVAIIAGAGTGKTTVMSARVEALIRSGEVDSAAILGLTFTNKAASQLRTRIAKQLGKKYQDQLPTISTYHSFARQLLIDHGAALGIEPDHRTLTDSARAQLALKVLRNTKLDINHLNYAAGRLVELVLNLDDLLAEHLLPAEDLVSFDTNWVEQLQLLATNEDIRTAIRVAIERGELVELVKEFRQAKQVEGLVDFADQMRLSVQLLATNPDLVQLLRETYKCVLLDEYQDTSVAQQHLLLLAFGAGHSVTAVGDPLQSIYAWRGASAETTRSFPLLFKQENGEPSEVLSLSKNYRSAARILASANSVIAPIRKENPGSIPLEQGDLKLGAGEVRVGCYENQIDEVSAITTEISSLLSSGVNPDDIAVLGRTTNILLQVHQSLVAAGVPAALVGVETITRTPEVIEIISLIEAASDSLAGSALARLLISPRLNIGDRDLAALAERARYLAEQVTPNPNLPTGFDALDPLIQASLIDALTDLGDAKVSEPARSRMVQLANEIQQIRNSGNALDAVYRAITILNLDIELVANPVSRLTQRSHVIAGFIDVVQAWMQSTDDQSLVAFLAWVSAAKRFKIVPKIEVPLVGGAVSLLTIHRAKGLEWPHVFVPQVTATVFPSNNSRSVFTSVADAIPHSLRGDRNSLPPDPIAAKKSISEFHQEVKRYSLDEELRLFYVALTRAQSSVTVTTSWWGDTQKKLRGPSEFFNELVPTATEVLVNTPVPADTSINPYLVEVDVYRNQATSSYREQLRQIADAVMSNKQPVTPENLSEAERQQVAAWDQSIGWLLNNSAERQVQLPSLVTATGLIKAIEAPEKFAQDFFRPLPTAPNRGSNFGTAIHRKIEKYYNEAALFDLDELRDQPKILEIDAATAFAAFESSKYAKLPAIAIEQSFQLPIGGILVSGRIDAVLLAGGKPLLIDWKTGNPKNANQLQLSLYRLAWSRLADLPINEIQARFVFLPNLTEVESDQSLNETDIEQLLLNAIDQ